jgi:predicted nucleic acid-binding protein
VSPLLVVDASVAVKWFKPDGEQHLEQALELLTGHRDGTVALAAPSHLRLEVINALWSKSIDAERLGHVARDLDDLDLLWFEIDCDLTEHAARIAAETWLTVYDAAYVALALRLDAPLVTCDAKIIAADACSTRPLGQPMR